MWIILQKNRWHGSYLPGKSKFTDIRRWDSILRSVHGRMHSVDFMGTGTFALREKMEKYLQRQTRCGYLWTLRKCARHGYRNGCKKFIYRRSGMKYRENGQIVRSVYRMRQCKKMSKRNRYVFPVFTLIQTII